MQIDFTKLPPDQFEIASKIVAEAARQGVDPSFALAIAGAETGGQFMHQTDGKVLRSPKGAIGVMQITPSTAELYRKRDKIEIDPNDLDSNIRGGVYILKDLLSSYKSPFNAAVAYNAGPKTIDSEKFKSGDFSGLPNETLGYVSNINKYYPLDTKTGFVPTRGGEEERPQTQGEQILEEGVSQPPPPPKTPVGERVMEGLRGAGEYVLEKAVENPEIPAAATTGAFKGVLEKVMQAPEKHLYKPDVYDKQGNLIKKGESTLQESRAANLAAEAKETRLNELKNEIAQRQAQGASVDNLQREFEMLQAETQGAGKELRARQQALKDLPKPVEPLAAVGEAAEASRKIPGSSGHANWARSMADEIPDVVAESATSMRKADEKGAQRLIDIDTAKRQQLAKMGLGDYELSGRGTQQLALPKDVAAERGAAMEAELAQKQAAEAAERARLAQEAELRRAAAQAEVEKAMARKVETGQAAARARSAANTARQKAASDATKIETAQVAAKSARQTAKDIAASQPSAFTIAAREAGRRFAEKGPVIGNVLGAAGTTISLDEAIDRYRKGDWSGMTLATIEAALNAASMAPPTSPLGLAVKGVGSAGSIGMIPVWIAHDYLRGRGAWAPKNEEGQPQKAKGGLALVR